MSDFDLADRPTVMLLVGCFCSLQQDVECDLKLSEDLNLMVTRNRTTMKRVANLVLAVNKLNKSLSLCGRDLSDVALCGAIMDCMVEEIVFQEAWNTFSGKPLFQRCSSVCEVTVSDERQKDLILTTREMKLQAITLKAGNCDREVNFKMCHYSPPSTINSLTVLLSVSKNLHISCSMEDGKVSLILEESLNEINQDDGLDRFLFFKTTPPRWLPGQLRVGEVPRLVHQHFLCGRRPLGGDVPGGHLLQGHLLQRQAPREEI
uniref:Interleukin-1 beta n=1 Tax=Xiphophorus couchianus TaxID=32473 RepID=A0A3B5MQM2_9TELE